MFGKERGADRTMQKTGAKTGRMTVIIAVMVAVPLIISCSGEVKDADTAIHRMIEAYGGPEKTEAMATFAGKGFIKKIPHDYVAASYPIDIYQKKDLYKNKVMIVEQGILADVRLILVNGTESFIWTSEDGKRDVPEWDVNMIKYRFPRVLGWVSESASGGELAEGAGEEGNCMVRFKTPTERVTLVIDDKNWLLKETVVESFEDSTFIFRDVYSEYRKIDDFWFPGRFSGYIRGQLAYEFILVKLEIGVEIPDSVFAITREDTLRLNMFKRAAEQKE